MTVVVTCRKCGFNFEVDRTMLLHGDWMDRCPICRPQPKPTDPATCAPAIRPDMQPRDTTSFPLNRQDACNAE